MSTYSFFEKFTDDKLFSPTQYGVIRVHRGNEEIRKKFNANDLVIITHQEREIMGILKFETGNAEFNKKSIYLTWDQRRDLALSENKESIIALEIRKGNLVDNLLYFFDSLFH